MQTLTRHRIPVRPLIAVVAVIAIALGTQLARTLSAPRTVPGDFVEPGLPGDTTPATIDPTEEQARLDADVTFWAARLARDARDTTSAVELAQSSIELARSTGDVTDYLRADAAADAALAASPGYVPAAGLKASILVALHRFADARTAAEKLLADDPEDAVALGVLADASLELGDLNAAHDAIGRLSIASSGAASDVRRARLAFIEGDGAAAVQAARDAVSHAAQEGAEGSGLAFYQTTLGDLLAATGHGNDAVDAYHAALAARSAWPAALAGLGRQAFAAGDVSGAIADYDQAIAVIPLPESLARRGDLYAIRAGDGDAKRSADDLATVEAIAKLAGDAASVYDRTLVLYLADHGLDPDRAVRMAADELAVRKDLYGYDAFAWALQAAGRTREASAAMSQALATGTRDPRVLYHAGVIALTDGRTADGRTFLSDALALDPGFDPLGATRARQALAASS